MAEEQQTEQTKGETMLAATSMLKPPKARTAMRVLPRTIEWENLFIIAGFAIIGLVVALTLFDRSNLQGILSTVVLFAVFGFILPSLTPLKGESILTWMGLQAKNTTAQRVKINGRRAKMYIGTFPLKRAALGHTRIIPEGGNVRAYSYDERGYPQMTTTKSNPQLEEQRRLRDKQRRRPQLKPSTTLDEQNRRGSRISARNAQQMKAAPRIPQAGEKRKSRVELNKKIKLGRRRR